jgi:hypothetical protein
MKKIYILMFLILLTIGNLLIWSQVRFYKEKGVTLGLTWQRSTSPDVAGYIVYTGSHSRVYTDSIPTTDTLIYLFVPERQRADSFFASARAVDSAGNISNVGEEIVCIPSVVCMDFKTDSLKRIDINDLRESQKKLRLVWGKTIYRKTKEAE